ncbi:hypothetical protein F4860DRAFT_505886 [Xylaria cubensis]|nr:hypothetical protein F4860DRAFT_505886 [Xylaria cubensis]
MENAQEHFEAATRLFLEKFPSQQSSKFDDEAWLTVERYVPQVLALVKNYNESQSKLDPLKPNMDFVHLLGNAANAVNDNDTVGAGPILLDTASAAYVLCPEEERDHLLWSLIQYLQCVRHFCTSEFTKSEKEMIECLEIRQRLLPADDLLIALAYVGIGQAVGAQERYMEGIRWLLKGGEILKGPAGDAAVRKIAWGYNTSRNYYCMGKFEEAEKLLTAAFDLAKVTQGWYNQVYGYLTLASLRTRMNRLDDAKDCIYEAQSILETSGSAARFSWVSSYCAYRAGVVAILQGRTADAIRETEKSVAIGKLVKLPKAILCRSIHAYSKALGMDPSRREESEVQRVEARQLRSQLPGGGGNLEDESDAAFERLVKMDQR